MTTRHSRRYDRTVRSCLNLGSGHRCSSRLRIGPRIPFDVELVVVLAARPRPKAES
jgi:hypothetical protein